MSDGTAASPRRLRILHMAFEDHRRPGSGGGSVRNHEINSRLARDHDVISVVSRYPRAHNRVEDGVAYRPLGLAWGHFPSMVAYHLAVPWYVMRHRADVVLEDFGAPHSSDLVPIWTACPTVAVVQYRFAHQKSREYHLPFWLMEDAGIRVHSRFIALSTDEANQLREVNPQARVDIVPMGVGPISAPSAPRRQFEPSVLFIGRLEIEAKGLDLLLDAFAEIGRIAPGYRLRIAGTGPQLRQFEKLIEERGLTDQVDFLGRVDGEAKWNAMRDASVILMPSRWETFGLVALEGMAVGTPVVAFAIPSLVEIVADSAGAVLIDPFDGNALGRAAAQLLLDPARHDQVSRAALDRAGDFTWEAATRMTERILLEVADSGPRSRRHRLGLLRHAFGRRVRRERGPT